MTFLTRILQERLKRCHFTVCYKILVLASKVRRMQVIFGENGGSDSHSSDAVSAIQIPYNGLSFGDGYGQVHQFRLLLSSFPLGS